MTTLPTPTVPDVEGAKRFSSRVFRRDVQGLRAVAVVAVLLDHAIGWPRGGFLGVDIFFVVSGYLITGLLVREFERSGHISFRGFYVRRARRILPASALVLVVTVFASTVLLGATRALGVIVDAVWATVFAANIRMQSTGTDYFQLGRPPSPLQHFWSLSIEEQFYFVWPWILLGILVVVSRSRRLNAHARWFALGGIAFLAIASLAWGAVETASSPQTAYFSTFARVWELGVGAVVALAEPWIARRLSMRLRPILAWAGLTGIVVSLFAITESSGIPVPGTILPVASSALIIIAGVGVTSSRYERLLFPLTNPVSRYLGDISYSLYLWHFPVIVLLATVMPAAGKRYLGVVLLVSLVLAALSYHFVEQPVRRSNWLSRFDRSRVQTHRTVRRRSAWVPWAAGATAIIAVTVSCGILLQKSSVQASPVPAAARCVGAEAAPGAGANCRLNAAEVGVSPSSQDFEADTGVAFDCYRAKGKTLRMCSYGSEKPTAVKLAIVGDSHAAMLLPGLLPRLHELDWHLDVFVGYGCQWSVSKSSDCSAEIASVQRTLLSGRYDAVLTTAARWARGSNVGKAANDYAMAWKPVEQKGTRVIVIGDNPAVTADALACISRVNFKPTTSACTTAKKTALQVTDALAVAARKVPNVSFVDLTSFFCGSRDCPAVIGNVIVYRDTAGHITATYSNSLAPYLIDRVTPLLSSAQSHASESSTS